MANVFERNGISGLILRGVVIAFAAMMFGCAPKAPVDQAGLSATISTPAR